MRKMLLMCFLASLMLIMFGCGGGGGGDGEGGEENNSDGQLDINSSFYQAEIGPGGGTLEVDDPESPIYGASIDVPEGVLTEVTTFTISESEKSSEGLDSIPVVFEPSGTFDDFIQVTLPLKNAATEDETQVLMIHSSELGSFIPSDANAVVSTGDTSVVFNVNHFSELSSVVQDLRNRYGVTVEHGPYVSPTNPFCKSGNCGQCTAFAWGRALDRLGISLSASGHGKTWWNISDNNITQTSTVPRANSIAVWDSSNGNPYGHVAYVEEVQETDGDVAIYFNEANTNPTYEDSDNGGGFNGYTKVLPESEMNNRSGMGPLLGYLYLDSPFSNDSSWEFDDQGTEDWNARNVLSQGLFKPNASDTYWQLGSFALDGQNNRGIVSPVFDNDNTLTNNFDSFEIEFGMDLGENGVFLEKVDAYFSTYENNSWEKATLEWVSGVKESGRMNLYRGTIPSTGTIRQVRIDFDGGSKKEDRRIRIKKLNFSDQGTDQGDIVIGSSIGSVNTDGWAESVDVSGSYAYVIAEDSTNSFSTSLQIIDIRNSQNPVVVGSLALPGWGGGVKVIGSLAYVANERKGFHVVDISNPQNPSIIGSVDNPGQCWEFIIVDEHAYLADDWMGLQIINIADPQNPHIVGSLDLPPNKDGALDIATSGSYAYLTIYGESNGIQIVDISDPQNPIDAGWAALPDSGGIVIENSVAYVSTDIGLQIFSITDPLSPTFLGSINTIPDEGSSWGLSIAGSFAYVHGDTNRYVREATPGFINTINIENPSNPTFVRTTETMTNAWDLVISDSHVYVGEGKFNGDVNDIGFRGLEIFEF